MDAKFKILSLYIAATSDNIVEVIKAFTDETRSYRTILEALLEKALECDELLIKLSPMFSFVGKNGIIQIGTGSFDNKWTF